MIFVKIYSMRQINNDNRKEIAKVTSVVNGAKELKSLECGSIFRSKGKEVRGDTLSQVINDINIISWNVRGLNQANKSV